MSRQDIVRMSYSQAEARCNPAGDRDGQTSPTRPACWTICVQNVDGSVELGRGVTQEEAWADAARKLKLTRV
jgi:hypothetical protein